MNARIFAAATAIAIIAVGCASDAPEVPIAAPAPVETVSPTTTAPVEDPERKAELAQLDARAVNCPEKRSDMVRYYEDSGEVMDCDQFGELLLAVAVAMEKQAQLERQSEFEAAVRAELREQAQKDREYVAAVKAELAAQAAVEARQQRQREDEEAIKRAIRQETAEAKQIGDGLLRSQCNGNGGTYTYWISPPRATVTSCYAPRPTNNNNTNSARTGAVCRDGWISSATGSGACSHHGGVAYWTY